jgi:hypothetical protein
MIHTHQTAPTQFVEANGIARGHFRVPKRSEKGGRPIKFKHRMPLLTLIEGDAELSIECGWELMPRHL